MLTFKFLKEDHISQLVSCLSLQRSDYIRHYHPFKFNFDDIKNLVSSAAHDLYIAIFLDSDTSSILIGLLTLRGLDEGYESPMLGLFISQEFSGRGYARYSLHYAEQLCINRGWKRLLLKVDAENTRAMAIYTSIGYTALCKLDDYTLLMAKDIKSL